MQRARGVTAVITRSAGMPAIPHQVQLHNLLLEAQHSPGPSHHHTAIPLEPPRRRGTGKKPLWCLIEQVELLSTVTHAQQTICPGVVRAHVLDLIQPALMLS